MNELVLRIKFSNNCSWEFTCSNPGESEKILFRRIEDYILSKLNEHEEMKKRDILAKELAIELAVKNITIEKDNLQ